MNLIDKSALVAEIERSIANYKKISVGVDKKGDDWVDSMSMLNAKIDALQHTLSYINTLEVKEVDLENSMVCKVDWYDGFLLDYTQEQQDNLLEKIGANVGDKIRVILIKE